MSVGRRIAVTCAVFGFVLAALAPGAGATATSFSYTGAAQSWTVPAGVSQAVFDLYGAQGTTLDSCKDTAKGAHVTAAIAVVPGESKLADDRFVCIAPEGPAEDANVRIFLSDTVTALGVNPAWRDGRDSTHVSPFRKCGAS